MSGPARPLTLVNVPLFLVHHRHASDDCGVVFASFLGSASPLRRAAALASCRHGGHEIWWSVTAETAIAALRLLPHYVATRSTATRVEEVRLP
jgi:hypothetical protein